jgi:trk system potassium uptake protein TrkA
MGLFGREVALGLGRMGHSVLAVDRSQKILDQVADRVDRAIALDSTDEEALYEARIDKVDVAVCAIGTEGIEASIMTTALLHQLGVPRIVSRAADDLHGRILRQVGAHEIVNPEEQMGRRLASQLATPGIREVLKLSPEMSLAMVPAPPSFLDKAVADVQTRQRYSVNIVGVQRGRPEGKLHGVDDVTRTEELVEGREKVSAKLMHPAPDLIFRDGDQLLVAGGETDIERMTGAG